MYKYFIFLPYSFFVGPEQMVFANLEEFEDNEDDEDDMRVAALDMDDHSIRLPLGLLRGLASQTNGRIFIGSTLYRNMSGLLPGDLSMAPK